MYKLFYTDFYSRLTKLPQERNGRFSILKHFLISYREVYQILIVVNVSRANYHVDVVILAIRTQRNKIVHFLSISDILLKKLL